jgi:hypothetical protein
LLVLLELGFEEAPFEFLPELKTELESAFVFGFVFSLFEMKYFIIPSTRAFADIALGHHKWYDGSAGYPADFSPEDSPFRTLIQIVQIADCLDAATDSVGRSYHKGKSFADVREEFIAGMGTVYAPWVVNLLKEPEVAEHLCTLLNEGRKENYRNTYYLLKQHA